MTDAKKTFGQHFEDGFTYLGDRIMEAKDHELERLKVGLLPDEKKIEILKRDLFEASRIRVQTDFESQHIRNLQRAIETISNQLETERNHRNSLPELMFSFLNSIILLGLLTAFITFPLTWTCNSFGSRSQACSNFRVIPNATAKFFSEPK